MSFGGWSVDRFKEPTEEYICAICREVYKDAVSVNCGHTFCKKCLDQSLFSNRSCPTCRVYVDVSVPSFYARKKIEELSCHCEYHEKGCSVVSSLLAMVQHEPLCPFKPVPCLKCSQLIDYNQQENHHTMECTHRMIECEDCKESIPYHSNHGHIMVCPEVDSVCSYCDWTGKRGEHHELMCEEVPVSCRYQKYGCMLMTRRKDILEHEDTNHTELICRTLDKFMAHSERHRLSQLQEGPFRVRGHPHRLYLCSDLNNHNCQLCNRRIKSIQQKFLGYHCASGCNYMVCVECLGTHRMYKSRMNVGEAILLGL